MRVVGGVAAVLAVVGLVVIAVLVGPTRAVPGMPSPEPPPAQGVAVEGASGAGDDYFPDAGNGGYDVVGYDIRLRYDPASDRLEGSTVVTATATEALRRFNLDLQLAAAGATVDGVPATTSQRGGELEITPSAPVAAGSAFVVEVDYAGVPSELPPPDEPIAPWTRTSDGAVAVGEPRSAAWWFPSNDHPSDKATVAVAVMVPAGVEVISNGVLVAGPEPAGEGQQQWRWRADQPMATYLAFVAIGQYVIDARDTPAGPFLAAYAESLPPRTAAAARAALDETPQVIDVLAQLFGPYPFDQLGGIVPGQLGLALETQTRPVYSSEFFVGAQGTEVVVHELAHQWFGDSVSVRNWRDIWLNEGFATYAEWLYDERTGGPSAQQRSRQEYRAIPADDPFWDLPPGDPGPRALFDDAVYVRGGMAVHAIRAAVGEEPFLAVLRAWTTERAGANAGVEDFLTLAERVSGTELDAVAQDWLYRPGRPDAPPG